LNNLNSSSSSSMASSLGDDEALQPFIYGTCSYLFIIFIIFLKTYKKKK